MQQFKKPRRHDSYKMNGVKNLSDQRIFTLKVHGLLCGHREGVPRKGLHSKQQWLCSSLDDSELDDEG